MLTLQSAKEILIANKPMLQKKYPLKSIGVFGSFSREEQTPKSDIDVLVEFSKPVGFEFLDLADELEKLLNHKVDLVSRDAIKPRLLKYVEEDLIYV
jgi:predicted nucleotidyltransferase